MNPGQIAAIPLEGVGHARHQRRGYRNGEYRTLANAEFMDDGSLISRRRVRPIADAGGDPVATGWTRIQGFIGNYKEWAIVAGPNAHKMIKADGRTEVDLWSVADLNAVVPTAGDYRRIVAFHRYNRINYWIVLEWNKNLVNPAYCKVRYVVYFAPNPIGGDIQDIAFADLTRVEVFVTTDAATDAIQVPTSGGNSGVGVPIGGYGGGSGPFVPTDPVESDTPVVRPEEFPLFQGSLIHKDRLWIFTKFKAYFSKVADFSIWTAPDGGMYNFLEYGINAAVGHKDNIYIACENSVWVLNYTSDPNTNASLRQISGSLGGDDICLNADTIYFARDDGLYTANDQTITRVLDLNVFDVSKPNDPFDEYPPEATPLRWKLVSCNDYIIAYLVQWKYLLPLTLDTENTNGYPPKLTVEDSWKEMKYAWQSCPYVNGLLDQDQEIQDYGAFFIQTNRGAISAFSINANLYFNSFFFVPNEDARGQQVLYILMESNVINNGGFRAGAYAHFMDIGPLEVSQNETADIVCYREETGADLDYQLAYTGIPWIIEISDWSPDGSEMYMKRFRALVFEADFYLRSSLYVAFDNEPYPVPPNATAQFGGGGLPTDTEDNRNPVPLRFILNQKARSISFKLYNEVEFIPEAWTAPEEGETYLKYFANNGFMIRAINLLWTPGQRGPTNYYGYARQM